MSSPTRHFGRFTGSGLRAPSFVAEIKSWPVDTPLQFTVQKAGRRKTVPQNNYLHQLYRLAAKSMNEAGYGDGNPWTLEKVKAYAKQAGLYPVEDRILPGGEVVSVALDTHELDKDDARETIERVIVHFAELGIVLPEPGEQQTMKLEQP